VWPKGLSNETEKRKGVYYRKKKRTKRRQVQIWTDEESEARMGKDSTSKKRKGRKKSASPVQSNQGGGKKGH